MLVTKAIAKIEADQPQTKAIDYLDLQWYETTKKIQIKRTRSGQQVAIRFLGKGQMLHDGDVLFENERQMIVVRILPTDALVINPQSVLEISSVCFEIGNKHLPLFLEDESVLLPYSHAMEDWLLKNHYPVERRSARLLHLLNANAEHHKNGFLSGKSLLNNKIKLSIANDED